jgi:hypothetical protein
MPGLARLGGSGQRFSLAKVPGISCLVSNKSSAWRAPAVHFIVNLRKAGVAAAMTARG